MSIVEILEGGELTISLEDGERRVASLLDISLAFGGRIGGRLGNSGDRDRDNFGAVNELGSVLAGNGEFGHGLRSIDEFRYLSVWRE